jgi:hypothetical protein
VEGRTRSDAHLSRFQILTRPYSNTVCHVDDGREQNKCSNEYHSAAVPCPRRGRNPVSTFAQPSPLLNWRGAEQVKNLDHWITGFGERAKGKEGWGPLGQAMQF